MLAEKLSEMMASFSDNRDSHYRAQLAALQADISLILKADPYTNKPLEDSGEEASELIAQIMGNNVPTAPSAGTDYMAQCGKQYARFVDAVNDAIEERDYNLTLLHVSHYSSISFRLETVPNHSVCHRTSMRILGTRLKTLISTRFRSPRRSTSCWQLRSVSA